MKSEQDFFTQIGERGQHHDCADGSRIYYYRTGKGTTPMLFLHNLRGQAELHHKILPAFVEKYDCILLDLPGHGRSSMDVGVSYTADYIIRQVIGFIKDLDLEGIRVVGQSIGATIALSLGARIPEKLRSIFASNPYDEGLIIGGPLGKVVSYFGQFSPIVTQLESRLLLKILMREGFYNKANYEARFLELQRKTALHYRGFARVFHSLLANQRTWNEVRINDYPGIPAHLPVFLHYGNQDWSPRWVRPVNAKKVGGNKNVQFTDQTGHFAFLDCPHKMIELITSFDEQP